MEKFSSYERVVGKISEEDKEQVLKRKAEQFDDQIFEKLKGREREKTPDELKIIDLANSASDKVRKKYEMDDFRIPPINIHIFKENEWPQDRHDDAFYDSAVQAIAIREQPARIVLMRKIFHEMLHFKSYHALQAIIEENPKIIKEHRMGLTVNSRDGGKRYFTNLNEAVTEELTKKFISQASKDSFFSQETAKTRNIIDKYPRAKNDSDGLPFFTKDTYYAETENKGTWRESVGRLFGKQKLFSERFTYQNEREILNMLIEKIFERSRGKFTNKDDVFDVFAKGMITGNILPVGRIVDGIFGKGTLRNIGELDKDIKKQEEYVRSL